MIMWWELEASYSLLECKTHLTLAKCSFLAQKIKRIRVFEHLQVNDSDRYGKAEKRLLAVAETQSLKSWCSYTLTRKQIISRQCLN